MAPVNPEARRRGRPRSDRARRAILEATRDQLAEHGYDRLSLGHVAEQAGVGKQTVYRWWSTKRELVAECVLEGFVATADLGPHDSGDLHRDITGWVRALAHEYGRPPRAALLRALVSAAADSEDVAAKLLARFGEPYRSAVVARLRTAREHELPRDAPHALMAEALVGAIVFRAVSREPIDEHAMVSLVELLIPGKSMPGQRRSAPRALVTPRPRRPPTQP